MRNFKKIGRVFLMVCIGLFTSFAGFAQVDPCTDPANYCPIDDYYPLLLVVVILIAAARAWKQQKKATA